MKHLVETSGNFMLFDGATKTYIQHDRPTVAEVSSFLSERIGKGEVLIIAQNLPEAANDADYGQIVKEFEGDTAAATASYMSMFGLDEHGRPEKPVAKPAPAPAPEPVVPAPAPTPAPKPAGKNSILTLNKK